MTQSKSIKFTYSNDKENKIPVIETKHLKLRNFTIGDADEYYRYHCNKEVLKYYDWRPETLEDAKKDIELIIDDYKGLGFIRWAVTLKENDVIIGDCGYIIQGLKGEISYILSKEYWHKGLMTEAVNGLIAFGFNEINLLRIQALTDPLNEPSKRILYKLGFKEEGFLRKYSYNAITKEYNDAIMWSLLKDEI